VDTYFRQLLREFHQTGDVALAHRIANLGMEIFPLEVMGTMGLPNEILEQYLWMLSPTILDPEATHRLKDSLRDIGYADDYLAGIQYFAPARIFDRGFYVSR